MFLKQFFGGLRLLRILLGEFYEGYRHLYGWLGIHMVVVYELKI